MLGICEVFMPLNYGEGSNAEQRLERKIRKRDEHQTANANFQPLSLSEKEQILSRSVVKYTPPDSDAYQIPIMHAETKANNALGA